MTADIRKTKAELVAELARLRRRTAQAARLRERLAACRARCRELAARCRDQADRHARECTLRDEALEALRLAEIIIDRSPAVLFRRLAGDDPRLVYVSANIRMTGWSAEDFLAERIRFRDIVHPEDAARITEEIRRFAAEDREEYTQHYRIVTRSGEVRWVEDQTSVVRDKAGRTLFYQGIVVDVTARRQAEEALRKSEEKFRRIVETAGEGFVMMDQALRITDANDAYCRLIGYRREELVGKTTLDLAAEGFRSYLHVHGERLLSLERRRLEGTLIAKDGRPVPVLIFANTLRDDAGAPMGHAAFVVDLTEQKKALQLAGTVQRSLVPIIAPRIPGLDIAGRSDACQEVGGDYFDFLYGPEYPGDKLRVVVGDVSGHGIDAALLMTSARAFIRTRATQTGSLSELLAGMNRDFTFDLGESGHFMTLFLAEIDPAGRRLGWVRAGHEPALLFSPAENRFDELRGPGVALGIDAESVFVETCRPSLAPGSILAIGTDGIWEARDPGGRPFGRHRLKQVLRRSAKRPASEIVTAVYDALAEFCRGVPAEDDVTLVVVKVG